MNSFSFEAIGTNWNIDLYDVIEAHKSTVLLSKIKERIEQFDKTYSRFRSDSLITHMSRKAGTYVFPDDAKMLLRLYNDIYTITEGAVTPLIGNVLVAAGYDATYSLKKQKLTTPPLWNEILEYDYPKLTIKKPAVLDFGAAGKGYLVDIVSGILELNGVNRFCIDASGDILFKNTPDESIRIGLEHPENPKQVLGVATIQSGSLCGSAGNRRTWGDFHHIINPHTLTSPKNILAVWATAETAMLADALTTCLFFTPAQKLRSYYQFEYAIVKDDYSLETSQDFPGEFFYN